MRDLIQRSDGWYAARLGCVTASKVHDVVARQKNGKYYAERANYLAEVVLERLTGQPTSGFTSAAMQHGIDTEPQARAAYSFMHDADVDEVGFVPHPTIEWAGASPDGLVGDDGMLEMKCPQAAGHLALLLGGDIDLRYASQMQFQMACAGRLWCDFASFNPSFPPHLQLHVRRIKRDDELIATMEDEVRTFLIEVDRKIKQLEDAGI